MFFVPFTKGNGNMKKVKTTFLLITISACFALTACSSTTESNNLSAEQKTKTTKKKACVAGGSTGSRLSRKC